MKRISLINCRLNRARTQAEVAADLMISEVYVRKIESGDKKPGRDTIIKFEQYYRKPAQELFPDLFLTPAIQNVSKSTFLDAK